MIDDALFDAEEKMEGRRRRHDDMGSIRTGRANPAKRSTRCISSTTVRLTPITQVASINTPEPRLGHQAQRSHRVCGTSDRDTQLRPGREPHQRRQRDPVVIHSSPRTAAICEAGQASARTPRSRSGNVRRKAVDELKRIQKDGEAGEDEVVPKREGARQDHGVVCRPGRRAGET